MSEYSVNENIYILEDIAGSIRNTKHLNFENEIRPQMIEWQLFETKPDKCFCFSTANEIRSNLIEYNVIQ